MDEFTDFLIVSMDWIQQSGVLGMVWLVVLYALTCVFFLPGSLLTVGAGAIYGFWIGVPLITVASGVGAAANFVTSRYLARKWIQRKFGKDMSFLALEKAVGREGWKLILISRISPVVPHSLVSYAAGLTNISFTRFFLSSMVGFLPLSAAYAYVGVVIGKVVRNSADIVPHDPLSWTLYIAGLAATVVVVILTARAATKAWRQHVPEPANGEAEDQPDEAASTAP